MGYKNSIRIMADELIEHLIETVADSALIDRNRETVDQITLYHCYILEKQLKIRSSEKQYGKRLRELGYSGWRDLICELYEKTYKSLWKTITAYLEGEIDNYEAYIWSYINKAIKGILFPGASRRKAVERAATDYYNRNNGQWPTADAIFDAVKKAFPKIEHETVFNHLTNYYLEKGIHVVNINSPVSEEDGTSWEEMCPSHLPDVTDEMEMDFHNSIIGYLLSLLPASENIKGVPAGNTLDFSGLDEKFLFEILRSFIEKHPECYLPNSLDVTEKERLHLLSPMSGRQAENQDLAVETAGSISYRVLRHKCLKELKWSEVAAPYVTKHRKQLMDATDKEDLDKTFPEKKPELNQKLSAIDIKSTLFPYYRYFDEMQVLLKRLLDAEVPDKADAAKPLFECKVSGTDAFSTENITDYSRYTMDQAFLILADSIDFSKKLERKNV